MAALDKYLHTETFLVGQRITLADIAAFCALEGAGLTEGDASLTPAICRWMGTCRNQPQFRWVKDKKSTLQWSCNVVVFDLVAVVVIAAFL